MEFKNEGALVDLLDRVLDKGLVVQADIVVTLAGVPLLGINLRAALASMDTMISYGMMEDLDEAIRAEKQEIKEINEINEINAERIV